MFAIGIALQLLKGHAVPVQHIINISKVPEFQTRTGMKEYVQILMQLNPGCQFCTSEDGGKTWWFE